MRFYKYSFILLALSLLSACITIQRNPVPEEFQQLANKMGPEIIAPDPINRGNIILYRRFTPGIPAAEQILAIGLRHKINKVGLTLHS